MVRKATLEDMERAAELAREMWAESGGWYAAFDLNEAKYHELMVAMIQSPKHCVLAYERDGEVIGGIAGGLAEMPATDVKVACDMFLFVTPDQRGTIAAARLVKAFVKWAEEVGAHGVSMGISTNINPERTGRLYEKLGFTNVGALYTMRLENGC